MPTDARLPVAVIGVGHLGRHHARLMKEVEGAELVGVVDPDLPRAREIAAGLEVGAFESVGDLPEEVRAVSIAAPTSVHAEIACPLLERGVHVLVEKPMAADLDGARAMREVAEGNDLVLHVGHIERFNPALAVLRDLDVEPGFIEAHRLAPFNYRTLDVSVVMDLMIHDLDIVMDLARSPVVRVDAVGSPILGREVDLANARLEFENGCVANVTASRVSFEPMRRTRVFSRDTFVSLDFGERKAFVVRKAEGFDLGSLGPESIAAHPPRDSFREFVQDGLLDLDEIVMDDGNPLQLELTAFVDEVRRRLAGEPPERAPIGATAVEGMRAMEIATAIGEKIAERRWS